MDKTLRGLVVALLFATVLIPFIESPSTLFPFITGKGFAFRLTVEAALAFWAILAIRRPEYRPRWTSPVLAAGAIFLAIVTAADFFAADPALAIWSKFERMDGLVLMLHLGAYALVLSSTLKTAADWRRFFGAHVLAAAAMAVFAATQILGYQTINQGGVRVDGTFGNAVYLAGYMLFSIGFAAFLALREPDRTVRGLYLGAAAAFAVVLAYTGTRGSVLGLVAGVAVAAAAFLTFGRGNPYRKVGAWVIGALALSIAVFAVGREFEALREHEIFGRYFGITLGDKTLLSRFVNAEIAWQGFLERPALGWGQGNYGIVFDSHYDQRLHDQEQYFDRTHSILTDWLVAGGALGFLAYFGLFALVVYGVWRAEHLRGDERSVLVALLAGYLVHNLFVFDNLVSYMGYAAMASLAIALGPGREVRRAHINADVAALAAAAALVALPIVAYLVNAAPMRAATKVIDAIRVAAVTESGERVPAHPDGVAGNRRLFEEAIAEGSFGSPEVAVQFMQAAATVAALSGVSDADRASFVEAADAALAAAVEARPSESYYAYVLGTYRLRAGNPQGAVSALERAAALAPEKQSTRAALALAYAWSGDSRALDYARETYELQTENENAWRTYVRVAGKTGRDDVFRALIAEAQAAGDHDRVIDFALEQAVSSPGSVQARISLAKAFVDAGRFGEALQVIDSAVVDLPGAKATLEAARGDVLKSQAAAGAAASPAGA
jgi:O-antigen ligase/Flp pilus assembly protein TadD